MMPVATMSTLSSALCLASLISLSAAAYQPRLPNLYAPYQEICPTHPLVRPAIGLPPSETAYVGVRTPKVRNALRLWLHLLDGQLPTTNLPKVGLAISGGSLRSLLTGAGVIQAFDARDGGISTSGLFQGLSYLAGLSGGAWLVTSLAGNNFPTVTELRTQLWEPAFANSTLVSASAQAAVLPQLVADLAAKQASGFDVTLVDPYGRLLADILLQGVDGGVATTLASFSKLPSFVSHDAPVPILTAVGVDALHGGCVPPATAPQYEFTPFEMGSWDPSVSSFTSTSHLGTKYSNGVPTTTECIKNYDALSYILGTSSDLLSDSCAYGSSGSTSPLSASVQALEKLVTQLHKPAATDPFAIYPNPFHNYPRARGVAADPLLTLTDGGDSGQNDPIWPFIQTGAKRVDVLIVNDNSANTAANFPDGSQIRHTYEQALALNLTRMPFIPTAAVFAARGLDKRATFFGCGVKGDNKMAIVYLPNAQFTYPSGESTYKLQYTVAETRAMVANGVAVATQGGDAEWPTCLGCAMVMRSGNTLGPECQKCFAKYCYHA